MTDKSSLFEKYLKVIKGVERKRVGLFVDVHSSHVTNSTICFSCQKRNNSAQRSLPQIRIVYCGRRPVKCCCGPKDIYKPTQLSTFYHENTHFGNWTQVRVKRPTDRKKGCRSTESGKVLEKDVFGVTLNRSFDPLLSSLIARSWVRCYSIIASIFWKKITDEQYELYGKSPAAKAKRFNCPKEWMQRIQIASSFSKQFWFITWRGWKS